MNKWLTLAVLLGATLSARTFAHAAALGGIVLKEQLGFAFPPQVLHYNLELAAGAAKAVDRLALQEEGGAPVLAQFKAQDQWDDGSVRHLQVSFIAGIEAYQTRRYTVADAGRAAPDDGALKLAREGDSIVLASRLAAVRILALSQEFPGEGQPAAQVPPPVSQVRGKTKWFGSAALDSVQNIKERRVAIVADGPITKTVAIEYTFAGGEKYVVDVTLNRGEELVRVVEDYTLTFTEPSRSEFAFNFAPGLDPDRCVNQPIQRGPASGSPGSLWDLEPYHGEMYPISYARNDTYGALAPWSPLPGQWPHFACYNAAGGDMVGIINTAPERWDHIAYTMSPGDSWKLVQNPHMFFTLKMVKNVPITIGSDKSLTAHFPLTSGHREWAFFMSDTFPRTDEVAEGAEKKSYPSGPRTYFIQKTRDYYWNSLDRIKDYTLAWPADKALAYPHIYLSKDQYEARRATYNAWSGAAPLPPTDDPATQKALREVVLKNADEAMRRFMTNPGPPHHITQLTYPLANLCDLLFGTGTLSPQEETRLKARLAYMAYTLNWHGYWAPEMGYAANPNMTSFCYDGVGLLGLLLADHPAAATWVRACTTEIDRELANWVSEDGAWIESTHYTLAAWQEHTMLMAALKHRGLRDYYRDPRLRKFIDYYFAIQTPPQPEYNLQRSIPCIGNSFPIEASKEFGLWAAGMADVDPAFAGNLMWMWKAAGFGTAAEMKGKILNSYGAEYSNWWFNWLGVPPYFELALKDPTIAPAPPATSNGGKFEGFGAVLNAHFPGAKETKLYYRSGPYYSHWDADEGSFILWAKGAPLCLDHGYGEFQPWLHNRIAVNHMYEETRGDVSAFFAGQGSGFVQSDVVLNGLSRREYGGVKTWPMPPEPINGRTMATPWTRRMVLMKDADPDGPNYFVLRDAIAGELPTEWCLWVYGAVADLNAQPIRATGKFGVDLLVYLLDRDRPKVATATVEMPADRPRQTLIHLRRPAGQGVLGVLFPILPNQAAPTVTPFADESGVKVATAARTDWVFVPARRASTSIDGVQFEGTGTAYSRQGPSGYYCIDRFSRVEAGGLGVTASTPLELFVTSGKISGLAASRDAAPTVTLSGPLAMRAVELACNGTTTKLAPRDGSVEFALPQGETKFEITLKDKP